MMLEIFFDEFPKNILEKGAEGEDGTVLAKC